jgi:hypothetical protein
MMVALKLTDVITWNWWIVSIPILIPAAIIASVLALVLMVMGYSVVMYLIVGDR